MKYKGKSVKLNELTKTGRIYTTEIANSIIEKFNENEKARKRHLLGPCNEHGIVYLSDVFFVVTEIFISDDDYLSIKFDVMDVPASKCVFKQLLDWEFDNYLEFLMVGVGSVNPETNVVEEYSLKGFRIEFNDEKILMN
jgi:hypothetical protein